MERSGIIKRLRAWPGLVPLLVGIASPIAIYRVTQPFGLPNDGTILMVALFVLLAGATLGRRHSTASSWVVGVLIYCGIPIGTFIDVVIDWFVFSRDRSLFPLEIVMWWMVALIAVPFGISVGNALRGEAKE